MSFMNFMKHPFSSALTIPSKSLKPQDHRSFGPGSLACSLGPTRSSEPAPRSRGRKKPLEHHALCTSLQKLRQGTDPSAATTPLRRITFASLGSSLWAWADSARQKWAVGTWKGKRPERPLVTGGGGGDAMRRWRCGWKGTRPPPT